jgi:hypothetical protein
MDEEKKPEKSGTEANSGNIPPVPESMPPAQIIPVPEWDQTPYAITLKIGVNYFYSTVICWLSICLALMLGVRILSYIGSQEVAPFTVYNEWSWNFILAVLTWGPQAHFAYSLFSSVVGFFCCFFELLLFIFAMTSSTWSMLFRRCFVVMLIVWLNMIYVWCNTAA